MVAAHTDLLEIHKSIKLFSRTNPMYLKRAPGRPQTLNHCERQACEKCGRHRLRVMQTRLRRGIRIRYLYCFGCGARYRSDEFVLSKTTSIS
jgi:hypothetical protein